MTMVLEKSAATERDKRPREVTCLDLSVADLETSLRGITYPAERQDLIQQAARNNASDDTMAFFHLLPNDRYHQFNDIALLAWSFLIV